MIIKNLKQVLEEMESARKLDIIDDDIECAHIEADDALVDLVVCLRETLKDEQEKQLVNKILNAYGAISKWYA